MAPRIRPVTPDDVDAVVGIALRAWAPVFPSIEAAIGPDLHRVLTPDWRASQTKVVESACASPTTRTWVADADDTPVGFVAVDLHPDQRLGEIHLLAVDPDHQRLGVGTALTEFAFDWIRDAGMPVAMVETGADPGHAAARRIYESAGCTELPIARYFKLL